MRVFEQWLSSEYYRFKHAAQFPHTCECLEVYPQNLHPDFLILNSQMTALRSLHYSGKVANHYTFMLEVVRRGTKKYFESFTVDMLISYPHWVDRTLAVRAISDAVQGRDRLDYLNGWFPSLVP